MARMHARSTPKPSRSPTFTCRACATPHATSVIELRRQGHPRRDDDVKVMGRKPADKDAQPQWPRGTSVCSHSVAIVATSMSSTGSLRLRATVSHCRRGRFRRAGKQSRRRLQNLPPSTFSVDDKAAAECRERPSVQR